MAIGWRSSFRHNIAIKRYCDKKIILRHRFLFPTKVSSEKNVTYLEIRVYLGL